MSIRLKWRRIGHDYQGQLSLGLNLPNNANEAFRLKTEAFPRLHFCVYSAKNRYLRSAFLSTLPMTVSGISSRNSISLGTS